MNPEVVKPKTRLGDKHSISIRAEIEGNQINHTDEKKALYTI